MSKSNNGSAAHLANWEEPDASQWMTFNEACAWARLSIGAEIEPEGDSGTSALLARANDGLIAIGAKRTERILERLGNAPECRTFDQSDGAVFMELLYASYHSLPGQAGGEKWEVTYVNYASGDFKFEIESKAPPFKVTYSVWGIVFRRKDVEAKFPLSNTQSGGQLRGTHQPDHTTDDGGHEEKDWLRISKAVRILHRILRTRLAVQEPAPWIAPPADPFDAECENATHRHRCTARTSLTMRRALLAGDLTAHLVKDGRSHPLPGWAWENASAAENAFNFNWIPLNPLLEHGLGEFRDWRCFVSRAEFRAWLSRSEFEGMGHLSTLPAAFDHNVQPDQLSYREPPDRPFVDLTHALTWIAFAVSLSRDEFGFMESCSFGPFAKNGWQDDLRLALEKFSIAGSAGALRVRGRYLARYVGEDTTENIDSQYLSDLQLRDFARFDSEKGGLERGRGLSWSDEVFDYVFETKGDGWHDVEVSRADLLNAFPAGTPIAKPKAVTISTAGAEAECRDWLTSEFASDPDKKRKKADFQSAALTRFSGRLSARGFIRAWDAVAPEAGRSKPGRKS